jgi:hypothetical protein
LELDTVLALLHHHRAVVVNHAGEVQTLQLTVVGRPGGIYLAKVGQV